MLNAWIALAGAILTILAWAIRPALLRPTFVLFGSLFVFQNANLPNGVSIGFVTVSGVLGIYSYHQLSIIERGSTPATQRALGLLRAATVLSATVPLGSLAQLGYGQATFDSWVRDAIGYFLIPVCIAVGAEAGLTLSRAQIWSLSVGASGAAALIAMFTWLGRRGGAELGFEQLGLASSFPVFTGVALCLTMYFNGAKGGIRWLITGLALLGVMVSTGGRQPAIFACIAIACAALLASGGYLSRMARFLGIMISATLAFFAVLSVSQAIGGGIAARRLDFFDRVLENGWSVVSSDGSVVDRLNAYAWTAEIWSQSPVIGRGLGEYFPSVRSGSTADGGFTLDTPLVVLAKFGVVGSAILCIACILVFAALNVARREVRVFALARPTFLCVSGILVLATLANGFPTENRGFPLFLLSLVMIGLSGTDRRLEPGPEGRPRQQLSTGGSHQHG
ncbi:hypothetical protein N3K63_01895 [Microbacterium sp. W1N]|uniref:hypothetical protein n=1 Tax=Microbacterium festucae TaxID=2977531 RepID=UPI0021BEF0AA|nr:hypothetical protein [Microbacterium festucae]MCT9819033.1 hypothetical protein [Microbacterium festucae]